MKNFLIFLAGFISGIVGIFLIALIYTKTSSDPTTIQGITLFEEPGEIIDCQSVEVFQVVEKGNALVFAGYRDICLLLADDNSYYYDNQRIKLSPGECFRQIGIYKYTSKAGDNKTIPVIAIYNE